jgi:histone deacetylase 1/2
MAADKQGLPSVSRFARLHIPGGCRNGETDIAINWDGGRHHAQRGRASGFCYVADIVLGIMLLAKSRIEGRRPRIVYLDLDIHNGDGVAKAFASPTHFSKDTERPPQVLTFSIHHSSPVFFPAPTNLPCPNTPNPFTLSIPLAAYPSSQTYERIYHDCVDPIRLAFKPDYVVLQLGADGLPGDPIGKWGAWSVDGPGGMAWYAKKVREWGVPMCVLGGGGYNNANAARAWTTVTSAMVSDGLGLADDRTDENCLTIYRTMTTLPSTAHRSQWTLKRVS